MTKFLFVLGILYTIFYHFLGHFHKPQIHMKSKVTLGPKICKWPGPHLTSEMACIHACLPLAIYVAPFMNL